MHKWRYGSHSRSAVKLATEEESTDAISKAWQVRLGGIGAGFRGDAIATCRQRNRKGG